MTTVGMERTAAGSGERGGETQVMKNLICVKG